MKEIKENGKFTIQDNMELKNEENNEILRIDKCKDARRTLVLRVFLLYKTVCRISQRIKKIFDIFTRRMIKYPHENPFGQ